MSAQEIIAELSKLKADELRLVKDKLAQLEAAAVVPETKSASDPFLEAATSAAKPRAHWPSDYALNHGHYVSGEPKK